MGEKRKPERRKRIGKAVDRSVEEENGDKGGFSFIIKVVKIVIFFVSRC
jgi:hypothetical protein